MKPVSSTRWNQLFFTKIDPRVYAGLRIITGIFLAIHLSVLARNWLMWFGESGVIDRASARSNIDPDVESVFFWLSGSPAVLWSCLAIIAAQVIAVTVGLATRFNCICVFIWLVSLHHRNNLIWEGEDLLLRIICFLLILMPAGLCWSIDSIIRRVRGTTSSKSSAPVYVWPLRLLQFELSFLYISSVLLKLSGESWRNGTAIQYVMRLEDAAGHRVPLANLFLHDLFAYQLLTWMTVGIEIMLGIMVWIPKYRRAVVLIGIAFHLGIELTMDLFLFQWMMILILATHLVSPLGRDASLSQIKNPSPG